MSNADYIQHSLRDTLPEEEFKMSSILSDLADIQSGDSLNLIASLDARKIQELSIGKNPLIGIKFKQQKLSITHDQIAKTLLSSDTDFLEGDREDQGFSLRNILSTYGLNTLSLHLNFKLPDIRIYSSGSLEFKEGLKIGDMTLCCAIRTRQGTLSFNAVVVPEISDTDTVLHAFHEQGLEYGTMTGSRYIHPHVSEGGSICMGEYEDLIRNSIKSGDLGLIPTLVVNLLEGINPDSVYVGIPDLITQARTSGNLRNIHTLLEGFKNVDITRILHKMHIVGWNMQEVYDSLVDKDEKELAEIVAEKAEIIGYKIIEPELESVKVVDEDNGIQTLELIDLLVNTPVREFHNSQQ